jgi:hypothetical protein
MKILEENHITGKLRGFQLQYMLPIKGTLLQDFWQSVCFLNQLPHLGPRLVCENYFTYGFVFTEIFTWTVSEIGFNGVNATAEIVWILQKKISCGIPRKYNYQCCPYLNPNLCMSQQDSIGFMT